MLHLVPQEPSQRTEYKNDNQQDDTATRSVIDHMARLDFKVKKEGATLISFHHSYLDYLDDNQLMDPSEAKQKNQVQQEVQLQAKEGQDDGGSDLEDVDEPCEPNSNRYRFDNVIKSMVARLECYNGLAPV